MTEEQSLASSQRYKKHAMIVFSSLTLVVLVSLFMPNSSALAIHPLFNTTLSGELHSRPAIRIDVIDDTETPVFGTLELYLTVQSSRFPNNVNITFPINVGDFDGIAQKYIQLPFEVQEGDEITFNLLDDDRLTPEQVELVVKGCKLTGYAVCVGAELYEPFSAQLIKPVVGNVSELLGEAIVQNFNGNKFDNVGVGEYIVQDTKPKSVHAANTVTLINEGWLRNNVHVQLKVYFPE